MRTREKKAMAESFGTAAVTTPPSRSMLAAVGRRNPPRFDGPAAWAKLTPGERNELGPILLELIVAEAGSNAVKLDSPYLRTFDAACEIATAGMHRVAGDVLPQEIFFGGLPPIPSLVGDVCRHCGCTEFDACTGGCFWVSPGLCSACSAEGRP